jgi:hypothetical protein
VLELLVVVEKEFKEQSINQRATGIERLYRHNYYNKVMVKLNKQQLKLLATATISGRSNGISFCIS